MNILGTGLSGLVGSRVTELLSPDFTFENLSLETGVDITDKKSVDMYFAKSDAPWVFHMAAYTDVQGAEKERGLAEKSTAWKVNVLATQNIADNCRKLGKKLLYIDTDYAFDGKKKSYSEDDVPSPLGWYALTKSEGAKRVLALGNLGLVIRISNPYRAHPVGKKDFVHKMLERMLSRQQVAAPADQIFAPTFIDDIGRALRVLVRLGANGIYHVVGSSLSRLKRLKRLRMYSGAIQRLSLKRHLQKCLATARQPRSMRYSRMIKLKHSVLSYIRSRKELLK